MQHNNLTPESDNTCYFCKKEYHMKKDCNGIRLGYLRKRGFTARQSTGPEERLYLGIGREVQVEFVGTF